MADKIFRTTVSWQVDSMLPRDARTINPVFRYDDTILTGGPNWQTLADDMAALMSSWQLVPGRQLTVKVYEVKEPVEGVPNRPNATKVLFPGEFAADNWPGELALCLSFFGGANGPSQRGRLYLPNHTFVTTAPSNRPTSSHRTKVGGLAPLFASFGGLNIDWGIWSPTRHQFTKAENWYVDDEWDIQRRRGLKPTTRTAGTTGG